MPALINTVIMTLLSLLIAVPLGIFSAIFLVEYAGRGNKFVEVIRLTTETLQGIPSIVYGLFGMLFLSLIHIFRNVEVKIKMMHYFVKIVVHH